jgi:hypothetical protein
MNLTELANFVCSTVSQTDTKSKDACKDFINRRYQMLWDSSLWTETLGVVSQSVTSGAETVSISNSPSLTFYHSSSAPSTKMEHPVAVRFTKTGEDDGIEIVGQDWVTFFRLDPNIWNNVENRKTTPRDFSNLPKDSSGNCRIKLIPTPDTAGTLYILGKLKWVKLGSLDTPALAGCENALLALAEHDMLKRSRQYGKAQSLVQEAQGHMQIMRDLEKGQRQSMGRIIPEDHYEWRMID